CLVMLFLTACGADSPVTDQTTLASTITTSTVEQTTENMETTIVQNTTTETAARPSSSVTSKKRKTTVTTTTITTTGTATTTQPTLLTPSSEMRAAWVSYIELNTVFRGCSTAEKAKAAIDGILDTMEEFKLNTLFFHVRANSDAYYSSAYFKPAASVSKLISAGFDPLGYAVEAAHKRGIALHAWVNPYRAGMNTAYLIDGIPTITDSSKRYYYVPSSTAAQQLILNGVRELVNNYAIDGIQYDDYFYPSDVLDATTVYGYESADYEAYQKNGGMLSIADWRRAAVDTLIAGTHTITKAKNRIFGVSPAINAENTYEKLYANPKKWMAESGYIDYICPQIYTGFEHSGSPFDKMTDAWLLYPRHSSVKLYVGIATYKAGLLSDTWAGNGKTEWATNTDILKRSVLYLRSKNVSGMAFYSYSYLKPDQVSGLSSTNDVSVALREIENLRDVL
ncbi:MAG: family 10 glycosylhydrolase, partial [Clostridia bacterium]|nr:family 10 glycosylhydrolase [Clostridia bacterium]